MTTVTYRGSTRNGNCTVTKENPGECPEELKPRTDLRNHSPDGFNWGYQGSGPAQLALALLCDVTGSDKLAATHYQRFKSDHVARWNQDSFETTSVEISHWMDGVGLDEPRINLIRDLEEAQKTLASLCQAHAHLEEEDSGNHADTVRAYDHLVRARMELEDALTKAAGTPW